MTIIAIDPGETESAIVAWDGSSVVKKDFLDNNQLLYEALPHYRTLGSYLYIEETIYAINAGRELCTTLVWSGRIYEAWRHMEGKPMLVPRATVKAHVCFGNAAANDGQVWFAIKERVTGNGNAPIKPSGPLGGLNPHQRQALALAITAQELRLGINLAHV